MAACRRVCTADPSLAVHCRGRDPSPIRRAQGGEGRTGRGAISGLLSGLCRGCHRPTAIKRDLFCGGLLSKYLERCPLSREQRKTSARIVFFSVCRVGPGNFTPSLSQVGSRTGAPV